MVKTISFEQIFFGGDDLVEMGRSSKFKDPISYHRLALQMVCEEPFSDSSSYLFSHHQEKWFFAKISSILRDSHGRKGAFQVHILVPSSPEKFAKCSPYQIMKRLIEEEALFLSSNISNGQMNKELPVLLVALEKPFSSKIFSVSHLLELSGRLLKNESVLLVNGLEKELQSASFEVFFQVEKEQQAFGKIDWIPFVFSMNHPSLKEKFPLKWITIPGNSLEKINDFCLKREIFNFSKKKWYQTHPQAPSSQFRGKHFKSFLLFTSLSFLILLLFIWKFQGKSNLDNISIQKKTGPFFFSKKSLIPNNLDYPQNKSFSKIIFLTPSTSDFQKARKELTFFRWPRDFFLSLSPKELFFGKNFKLWLENSPILSLSLSSKEKKVYQERVFVKIDDFFLKLEEKKGEKISSSLEKKCKTIYLKALQLLEVFLESPSKSSFQNLNLKNSSFDLPFGIRSSFHKDLPVNGMKLLLENLAYFSYKSQKESQKVFLWILQEWKKK